jgi:hypothetical protein
MGLDSALNHTINFAVDSPGLILTTSITRVSYYPEQQTIFKTDSSGFPLWTKRDLSTADFEGFSRIFPGENHEYVIYASSPLGSGAPNPCIVRTDASGNYGCPYDSTMIPVRPNAVNISTDTIIDSVYTVISSAINVIEEDTMFTMMDQCYTTGISYENKNSGFSIHPNPATDRIYYYSDNSIGKIIIRDIEGRIISEFTDDKNSNQIDIRNYPPGIYFLTAVSNRDISTRRFVIQ